MQSGKILSVIIPAYNEEKTIKNTLKRLTYNSKIEVIVVDGGSSDRTLRYAKAFARTIISFNKGRALQMNEGAKSAKGDILLFLHADCSFEEEVLESIRRCIDKGYIGGCLTQRIDKKGIMYRLIEGFGNIRAMLTKVFYGDQGIFVCRDIFLKIGGFRKIPIMEDVLFTKNLRKLGKTIVLPNKISVSARRWQKNGIMRTIFLYSWLNILFWLKVPLNKIKAFYDDLSR